MIAYRSFLAIFFPFTLLTVTFVWVATNFGFTSRPHGWLEVLKICWSAE